jgi:hypothetical protein
MLLIIAIALSIKYYCDGAELVKSRGSQTRDLTKQASI